MIKSQSQGERQAGKSKASTPQKQSPVLDDASAMRPTTNQTWHAQTASPYYGMTSGLKPVSYYDRRLTHGSQRTARVRYLQTG